MTYWYEVTAAKTDSLNFTFLKIVKYAPFSIMIAELYSLIFARENIFIVRGQAERRFIFAMYFMVGAIIIADLYFKFFEDPSQKFARLYGANTDYMSRLSTLQRKKWIAQELFNRKEFNLHLTEEETLANLCRTKGIEQNS